MDTPHIPLCPLDHRRAVIMTTTIISRLSLVPLDLLLVLSVSI